MRFFFCTAILFLSLSCKKDKLNGDKEIFIGKWKWTETVHAFGLCEGDNFSETLTPESTGNQYSMEFFKNGTIKYYENENYLGKSRIVFSSYGGNCSGSFSTFIRFEITLDNNSKDLSNYFTGCISDSEMQVTSGFPFEIYEKYCEFYSSHFIKE